MTRHLGKLSTNDEELIVVYMLIPDQTSNALVTRTSRLTGPLRNEMLNALTSAEGQQANNFADVLGRKFFADSGRSLIRVLHEMKLLEPVAIDEVVMIPQGNHRIPLRDVLEAIGALPKDDARQEKFNPHTHNSEAHTSDESMAIAHNLLAQAELLESDANQKREEAFRLAPSLRSKFESMPAEMQGSLVESLPTEEVAEQTIADEIASTENPPE